MARYLFDNVMDSTFKSSKRIEDFGNDMDARLSWHRSHRIVAQGDTTRAG